MKLILLSFLMFTSTLTFASTSISTTELIETLEDSLTFSGYVEIDTVTKASIYTVVEFHVGAYGDERPTSCVFKYDKLISCKDGWFKF